MNAAGSKGDALVTRNGRGFNKPWDGVWEGKARIDAEGWTAELAIPFKTLSFDPANATRWGFNMQTAGSGRLRRAATAGAGASQDVRFFGLMQMSVAGTIEGMREGLTQGIGLDIVPFEHRATTINDPVDFEGGRGIARSSGTRASTSSTTSRRP